jgi:hypothetical protein
MVQFLAVFGILPGLTVSGFAVCNRDAANVVNEPV